MRDKSGHFPLVVAIALALTACGAAPLREAHAVTKAAAPYVDPLLKVLGFCAAEGADPALVEAALANRKSNRLTALTAGAVLLSNLADAGVAIPPDVMLALGQAYAAVEGLQQGLRALDGRDPHTGQKAN